MSFRNVETAEVSSVHGLRHKPARTPPSTFLFFSSLVKEQASDDANIPDANPTPAEAEPDVILSRKPRRQPLERRPRDKPHIGSPDSRVNTGKRMFSSPDAGRRPADARHPDSNPLADDSVAQELVVREAESAGRETAGARADLI